MVLPEGMLLYVDIRILAYEKAVKIIDSVKTIEQYEVAENYCELYRKNIALQQYNRGYSDPFYTDLSNKLLQKFKSL